MRKQIISSLVVVASWWFVTVFKIISPILLPSPITVAEALIHEFVGGKLYLEVYFTVYRTLCGLLVGSLFGIPLGIIFGSYPKIYQATELLIDFFRSLPAFALMPLFIIIFGVSEKAMILLAGWAVFFVILINTTYGVKNVKESRIAVGRILKMNKIQLFFYITLFDALPSIVAGLRIGVSFSLVVTVVAEMLMGAKIGLGKYIFEAASIYRIPEMYAGIFLIGFLGYCLNKLFVHLEKKYFHWGGK